MKVKQGLPLTQLVSANVWVTLVCECHVIRHSTDKYG